MQARNFYRPAPRRHFLAVTLWVVCALLAHSFDNCAAHIGELTRFDTKALQVLAACPHGACQSCAPTEKSPPDGCDAVSESAVRVSAQQHFESHAVVFAATSAVVPAVPQLFALSGCLHGRPVPPPRALVSTALRSSLPARAPPLSA